MLFVRVLKLWYQFGVGLLNHGWLVANKMQMCGLQMWHMIIYGYYLWTCQIKQGCADV